MRRGLLLIGEAPVLFVRLGQSYFVTRISTRRFFARPASVVFGSTGLVSAYPCVVAAPRPPSVSAFAAFAARDSDSSLFVGNLFFSAPWIGRLSVWPSTATLYSGKSFSTAPTCFNASTPAGFNSSLTGTEQIAGGQVDQQPLVVEIDGDVTLLDLRTKRPDQSTLSFFQFRHFGIEFAA